MNQPQLLSNRILAVCDACGDFIEYWGFKSIHGRVWAYLALIEGPVSQAELSRSLGVSRSLINMAISDLSEYGLVRPSKEHHHAPYEAVLDVWPIISDVLRRREWMLLEKAKIALESALEIAEWSIERRRSEVGDPSKRSLTELGDDHLEEDTKSGEKIKSDGRSRRTRTPQFNTERIRHLLQMTEWSQGVLKLLINAKLPEAHERWGAWIERAMKLSQTMRGFVGKDHS